MGKKSQAVQAARRAVEITPDVLMDMAANPPLRAGDALGSLQWHNHLTGQVTRWTVLRGRRANNYVLRAPDGRVTRAHGWAWILDKMRPILLRR